MHLTQIEESTSMTLLTSKSEILKCSLISEGGTQARKAEVSDVNDNRKRMQAVCELTSYQLLVQRSTWLLD